MPSKKLYIQYGVLFLFTTFIFLIPHSVLASNIKINEFYAAGSTSINPDWVEIYNDGLDISLYQLIDAANNKKDLTGASCSGNFCTIDWFNSLNNTGDTIKLVLKSSPDSSLDQITYGGTGDISTPGTNQSAGRNPDETGGWIIFSTSTKGSSNNSASSPSPSPSPSPSSSPTSYFTISGVPSEIESTQNFKVNINLQLPNNQNTDYYLKGAFKKVGAVRYFGMTKVGSSWINYGSDLSNQLKITTNSSGQWSGDIEVQPDVLDSDYEGTGDYVFKVGRYTESGNGPTWTSETKIKINAKEVEDQGGVIDLSKLSSKETPKVLGETKKEDEKLPDSVYSLENYRRSATISSTPSSSLIEIKGQKQNLFFPIAGGILLGLGLGLGGYLIIKNRVK